jgi:predicted nucleic acid-binding protein
LDPLLQTVLDYGEASVIQLAREMKADYVLIDERKGRKIAREIFSLKVIGTARILVEAKRKGIIDSVGDALNQMRDSGYRLHDNIIRYALKESKEL